MAVRSDAARGRQRGEKLRDPRNRPQLALECVSRTGGKHLEECVGQLAPEPNLDRGRKRSAIFAEAKRDRLVDRGREIYRDQAFPENAPEDELTVDQDAVAIEDNEIVQEGPLSLRGGLAA